MVSSRLLLFRSNNWNRKPMNVKVEHLFKENKRGEKGMQKETLKRKMCSEEKRYTQHTGEPLQGQMSNGTRSTATIFVSFDIRSGYPTKGFEVARCVSQHRFDQFLCLTGDTLSSHLAIH